MTPEELAELRRLEAAATPGPWEYFYDNDVGPNDEGFWEWWEVGSARVTKEDDAALIAAARNALPRLLDRIDELTAENERLRDDLAAMMYEDGETP